MILEVLKNSIRKALKETDLLDEKITLEHPVDLLNGDYSTNIALVLAKKVGEKPRDVAEKIVEKIKTGLPLEVEKVEVAGAGFINFYLSPKFYAESLKEIIKNEDDFGKNKTLSGKKTMVEYTDPNPFKEFHIGHLMSNAIGEAISRLVEFSGAEVKRTCYQGDVGLHVAKAIWSISKKTKPAGMGGKSIIYDPIDAFALGQAYSEGDLAYKSNDLAKKEIIEINKKIYKIDPVSIYSTFSEENWYQKGRKISLDYFETIYKKLGTKFEHYFFESETGKFGKEIVEENIGKVFERSDGAIIFKGENYGLHTRVFINSEGLPTYEAKELGLAKIKYDKYKYDRSVVITGNEVNEYFKVLLAAMKLIFPDLAEKTAHISHGMLRLPSGKMSSRTGDVITALSLIDQIKKMVLEKVKDRDYTEGEKEKVSEGVAIGAIKYSILRQSTGSNIIYDFEKSISFEGDSGPYLQYSYARAVSVLRKSDGKDLRFMIHDSRIGEKVGELEKLLYRFPEIVKRASDEYEPHYLVTYLTELAGAFNAFYANNKILEAGEDTPYRLAITKAFAIVMKNGLNLLAIPVLEKM